MCMLTHRERSMRAHQSFTVVSPCGQEAHSLLIIFLVMLQVLQSVCNVFAIKKPEARKKDSSCFSQGIQSTSQALCWPPDRHHLICPPHGSKCGIRYIISQIRKLRLEKDIQLVRAGSGSHMEATFRYPCDVTLFQLQSVGERGVYPYGMSGHLS